MDKLEQMQELEALIRYFRLNIEKKYYEEEIKGHEPKIIGEKENFFSKAKKSLINTVNSNRYDTFSEKLIIINSRIDRVSGEITLLKLNDDTIKEYAKDAFKDDELGLARLEFAMSVILDNTYTFETNKYSYPLISKMLGLEDDYMFKVEEKMKEAYTTISLDKNHNLGEAMLAGGILSLILLSGGAAGIFGGLAAGATTIGAGVASSVAVLAASATIAGLATVGLTYTALNTYDKHELKKEFAKLSVDETVFSLVKTTLSLIHIRERLEMDGASEIYDTLVNEYIDLKGDVDVRLFIGNEDIEDNKKKNEIFYNADVFLKEKLFA